MQKHNNRNLRKMAKATYNKRKEMLIEKRIPSRCTIIQMRAWAIYIYIYIYTFIYKWISIIMYYYIYIFIYVYI